MDSSQLSAKEMERRRKISEAIRGKRRPDLAERNKTPEARSRTRVISEEARSRMAQERTIHGHSRSRTAGQPATHTYWIWQGMIRRCTNPNNKSYHNYGGRGIEVCERWLKFEDFLADMGERPDGLTIDRIDNDGNYEPGNCRWATRKEQRANQRPGPWQEVPGER